LTVPDVAELSRDEWETMLDSRGAVAFIVDESPVLLLLTVER